MFICQSCIRRHFQRFTAHSIQTRGIHKGNAEIPFNYSTTKQQKDTIERGASTRHILLNSRLHGSKTSRNDARRADHEQWLQSRGQRPAHKQLKPALLSDKSMKKHLEFLGDPLKLAQDTLRTLRQDKFDEALEVVRAASKNVECVVSWNHLIDWQLSKGKVNGAIKTYQEMKKRAQHPDNHTFTVLFRGFAAQKNHPSVLEHALSIYHSMALPNARVRPNKTHTNAMLKVCARSGNMDALFGIAGKLPDRGFRAADNLTFTIILNAMRENVLRDAGGFRAGRGTQMSEEQERALKKKTVIDARRIWDDVIRRWRRADLFIDEELVCSMARLLLAGHRQQDWDDVFSLLQQTMNITRPFGQLGTPERDRHESSLQTHTGEAKQYIDEEEPIVGETCKAEDRSLIEAHEAEDQSLREEHEAENDLAPGNEFRVVNPPPPDPNHGTGGYVRPGTNALSVAMEALGKSSMKRHALYYWNIFTKDHGIKPDRSNYAGILRIFRIVRASSDTLEVLLEMDPHQFENKHFRIALSTCDRDKNNPNAFATAGKILDLMSKNTDRYDPKILTSYLGVVTAKASEYNKQTVVRTPEEIQDKYAVGRRIQRGLFRLEPFVIGIRSYLNYGKQNEVQDERIEALDWRDSRPSNEYIENAIKLFTRMISAYDKLIWANMVSREELAPLKERRNILNAFSTRQQRKLLAGSVSGARRFLVTNPDDGEDDVEREIEREQEEPRLRRRPGWRRLSSEEKTETEEEEYPPAHTIMVGLLKMTDSLQRD